MIRPQGKKLKRGFKKRRRQVEALAGTANDQLDKLVFKKIDNIQNVWRFIVTWLMLLVVLVSGVAIQARALGRYYIGVQAVGGGEFVEGIQGVFSNANPIYATSSVDTSVSRLLFSGLLKYDDNGQLVGDLAESWSVDEAGKVYTVILKPSLKWHDGEPITSDDVVFTIQAIQNADTRSPYNLSWQGVGVAAVDSRTVTLSLPNPLTAFAYSLTQGIIPKHRLGELPYAQLRSDDFNNRTPVGSGPFQWNSMQSEQTDESTHQRIRFKAFENYHFGRTKLDRYTVETFDSQDKIINAMKQGTINGAMVSSLADVESELVAKWNQINIPLMSGVYLFFNTQKAPLNEKKVRNAFEKTVIPRDLRAQLGYPVIGVDEAFLRIHGTYDAARKQTAPDLTNAGVLLDEAGWLKAENSFVRQKDGKVLEFTLLSEQQPDYARLADVLQHQFADVGVKLNVDLRSGRDFQQALLSHQYDALLYGIAIGADPDVYAYWHSSQAISDRFNFSEYKSATADTALEAGRTRTDLQLRIAKYKPFLDAWRDDSPAVGLYQPRLLFVTNGALFNFDPKSLATTSDRYQNIHEWMVNTEQVPLSTTR